MMKKILFLLVLTGILTGCATQQTLVTGIDADEERRVADYMRSGQDEARNGNQHNAALYFGQALRLNPENREIRYTLAKTILALQDFQGVIQLLEEEREGDWHDPRFMEMIATSYLKLGNLNQAESWFARAVHEDDTRWPSWNGLGVVRDLQGKGQDARGYYHHALHLSPRNPKIINNLGYSYVLEGDHITGEGVFREGLRDFPENQYLSTNLAIALSWQGRKKEAIQYFELSMDRADARNNAGYIAMLDKRHQEAEQLFIQAKQESLYYNSRIHKNYHRNQRESFFPAR